MKVKNKPIELRILKYVLYIIKNSLQGGTAISRFGTSELGNLEYSAMCNSSRKSDHSDGPREANLNADDPTCRRRCRFLKIVNCDLENRQCITERENRV